MTEPLQIGQFAIVDHEPVERGPNAGTFMGRGPAGERAELYLLAEGTTPAGESFAGHVISSAGQRWQTLDISVTGALREVFAEADAGLREWNRKSIAQHRVRIGLTAIARKGEQTILAQAGPSVVFHWMPEGVQVYAPDEEYAAPLGMNEAAEPQLRRIDLRSSDRLLLISTAALSQMDDDIVAGILGLPSDTVLPNLFRRVRGLRDVTALLLAGESGAQSMLPPGEGGGVIGGGPEPGARGEEGRPGFQPSLFISDRGEDDVAVARRQIMAVSERLRAREAVLPSLAATTAVPAPLRRAAGGEEFRGYIETRTTASVGAGAMAPGRLMPGRTEVTHSGANTGSRDASFTRGLSRRRAALPPARPVSDAPLATEMAATRIAAQQPVALASTGGESLVRDGSPVIDSTPLIKVRSSAGGRWRPDGPLSSKRELIPAGSLPPTWMIVVAGLAVLFAVVGFIAGPQLIGRSDNERFVSLVNDAERNLASARALQDPTERRASLTSAQALLLEARDLAPESTEVSRLLLEVTEGLNQLDGVRAPVSVEAIADLRQFGERPLTPDTLVAGGGQLFLLDGSGEQVVEVDVDGGAARTVYKSDGNLGQGRPIAIAYYDAPDLGVPALLVADANKQLWLVNDREVRQLPFAVSGGVTDIATRAQELYVLDASAKAVFRLAPSDGGFVGPARVIEGDDLASAARLTIDGDEIFTSDKDGTIHRFAGKLSLTMSTAGIDKPLTAARRAAPIGNDGEVAVLDPANDRIVVLRRDGTFAYQYRHADFAASAAMAIEDGVAYIFSGGYVRRVALPSE
ncbi:MAG: hypothetical protein AB7H85_08540 [Dehalococcoidia bacterium]